MIRPLTCLCMLLAGGSGLYLYQEKHRTSLLDREITRTIHATEAAHERTGLLRAEWALLNEPGRLQDLADRFLALHAMSPAQFVPAGELARRLPAVVVPSAAPGATDAEAVVADARPASPPAFDAAAPRADGARVAASRPEAAQAVASAAPAADAVRPALPRPAAPVAHAVLAAAEAKAGVVVPVLPRPVRVALAEAHQERRAEAAVPAPARSYAAAVPVATAYSGSRVMAPVLSALATPVLANAAAAHPQRAEPLVTRAAAMMPVRPAATPSVPAAPVPYAGSSLGTGRASLPAPVPMGAWAQ